MLRRPVPLAIDINDCLHPDVDCIPLKYLLKCFINTTPNQKDLYIKLDIGYFDCFIYDTVPPHLSSLRDKSALPESASSTDVDKSFYRKTFGHCCV